MRTALVAYDANVFRGAILQALITQGFKAHGAADQNAMLALHAQLRPVLVVVGEHLSPFGAHEAIRAVRGFDSNASKIVAVTPETDLERARQLRAAGADEVVLGGYTWHALRQKLRVLHLI